MSTPAPAAPSSDHSPRFDSLAHGPGLVGPERLPLRPPLRSRRRRALRPGVGPAVLAALFGIGVLTACLRAGDEPGPAPAQRDSYLSLKKDVEAQLKLAEER